MEEVNDNIQFKITEELLDLVQELIENSNDKELKHLLKDYHHADIAEILNDLELEDALYVIKLLDSETTSDILIELDDDIREKVLKNLSAKEIAEEIEELDTDDAADIIAELPISRQHEVISKIEDEDHKAEIQELLTYAEDSAGGLMAKELVKVYETWTVAGCLRRIRGQAENVTRVHSVYVVDKKNKLIGRLSLKDLITAKSEQKIADIYISSVDYVYVDDDVEEVAKIMAKYDLEAIPVVDRNKTLLGRITIDDIIDVIREEADKDYQLAAGITQDIDADDSYFKHTKARLPWLLLALFGGFVAVQVSGQFEGAMANYGVLFFFTPLIAAMAGNVGVQSSAIIVQGIANGTLGGSLVTRLLREVVLSLLNGLILGLILFLGSHFITGVDYSISLTVAIALITVMLIAALIGTFVPITLDKYGIDPALATGPFITTSNDIFGILIYFSIAKGILGF